jgi:hypothetical protein
MLRGKCLAKCCPARNASFSKRKKNNYRKCVIKHGPINADSSTIHQLLLRYAAFITVGRKKERKKKKKRKERKVVQWYGYL